MSDHDGNGEEMERRLSHRRAGDHAHDQALEQALEQARAQGRKEAEAAALAVHNAQSFAALHKSVSENGAALAALATEVYRISEEQKRRDLVNSALISATASQTQARWTRAQVIAGILTVIMAIGSLLVAVLQIVLSTS